MAQQYCGPSTRVFRLTSTRAKILTMDHCHGTLHWPVACVLHISERSGHSCGRHSARSLAVLPYPEWNDLMVSVAYHACPAFVFLLVHILCVWRRPKDGPPAYDAALESKRMPKTAPVFTQSQSEAAPMWADSSLPKSLGFAESVERARRRSQGRPSILRR